MIDAATNLTVNLSTLIQAVAVVVAAAMVLVTLVRTRAFVPVLGSAIVGGFVVWAVSPGGLGWFTGRIEDDANTLAAGHPTAVVLIIEDVAALELT